MAGRHCVGAPKKGGQGLLDVLKTPSTRGIITSQDAKKTKMVRQGLGIALAYNEVGLEVLNLEGQVFAADSGEGTQFQKIVHACMGLFHECMKPISALTLRELNLARTGLDIANVEILSKGLAKYTRLKRLVLNGNKIGDEGARAMARVLPACKSPRYVDLSDNPIGGQGRNSLTGAGCNAVPIAETDGPAPQAARPVNCCERASVTN